MKRFLIAFVLFLSLVTVARCAVTVLPGEIKVSRVGEITIVVMAEESYDGVTEIRVTVPFDVPSVMSNRKGWFSVILTGKGKLVQTAVSGQDIVLSVYNLKVNDKVVIAYGSKNKKGVGVKALKAGTATFITTLDGQSVTTSVNVLK